MSNQVEGKEMDQQQMNISTNDCKIIALVQAKCDIPSSSSSLPLTIVNSTLPKTTATTTVPPEIAAKPASPLLPVTATTPLLPTTTTTTTTTVESESQTDDDHTFSMIVGNANEFKVPLCTSNKSENEFLQQRIAEQRQQQQQQQQQQLHKNIEEIGNDYLQEPEVSLIEIKEKLVDHDPKNVPLADSESEEDDQLKPLITDNHTILDHQEYFNYNALPFHPQSHMILKHSDYNKDSFSSTDSDISINYDHRNSSSHQGCSSSTETPYCDDTNATIKDLGCDLRNNNTADLKEIDTLSPAEIPDDRMCEEIVEQVEYYFSNDSILKDAFLLKHVRRNKEGFVSLKLVSSFKRVRQLTKDWRVVGNAIKRKSRKIELNDLGTKIRRLEPLPSFDETMPSRTIVACDLPVDKLCIEKVTEIFSKCGEIALVRILRPGMGIPVDVRQFMNKYPEMQQKECALVEFIESTSARMAKNISGDFQVYDMVAPKKKTGKKAQTVTKMIENYKYHDVNYERTRGGSGTMVNNVGIPIDNDLRYKLRRNSFDYYQKPEQQHICQQRKYSYNNSPGNMELQQNHGIFSPRRISNCSMTSVDRKYSSCSEGYSSCSDMSRRPSSCSSDQSRRTSNCSDMCPCTRRISQCSDIYRRISQCSEHNSRRFSNGSIGYDRSYSNPQDIGRRISIESNNYERKISAGSMNGGSNNITTIPHDQYRKFSNGFDPNRKFSNPDQYYHGRRTSTDSGYDRKLSFGSDYSNSPRSRSNSFLMCQHKNSVEAVVRTPIGPDGSKGFASRTRKLGQIVQPVN